MPKDTTTIQVTKDTREKLSALKRKMSLKLDKDLTFDELIQKMIHDLESK